MENLNLKELQKINTSKVTYTLYSALGRREERNHHIKAIIVAYIIAKMQSTTAYDTLQDFLDNSDIPDSIKEIISRHQENCWGIVKANLSEFTFDELMAFILFDNTLEDYMQLSPHVSTPASVLKLVDRILDVKDTDEIVELCSGKGNFAVELTARGSKANYTGVELNYNQNDIATIRTSLIKENCSLILSDALEYKSEKKADKGFANYPFSILLCNEQKETFEREAGISNDTIRRASSDWMFNIALMQQLKADGKAVVVMKNGSTWNNTDRKMRQYFVEQGYIEAVISLPAKLFRDTVIQTALYVLSRNNQSVKLVDAKNLFVGERRRNILSDENVEVILKLIEKEGDASIRVTIEELANNEFILNASRYLETVPPIKNGVEFGTVIKNITRGSQLKASDFDEYKSTTPTNYKYLLLSNINDGVISIDNDNQYLTEIPEKLEKYCIKNNDIVLSKIGMPAFKSAVAEIEEGVKVVAGGNLFVIEVDEEKANPFYIQAFFASDLGAVVFKNIYTGAEIPTITIEKLKRMIVPLPPVEEQNIIANRYAASMDELIVLRRKVEKTKNRMKHIFDEGE